MAAADIHHNAPSVVRADGQSGTAAPCRSGAQAAFLHDALCQQLSHQRRDGAGRKPGLFCQFDPGEPALGEQCPQNQASVLLFYSPQAGFSHIGDSFQTPLSSLISDYEISTVYRIARCLGYIKTYFGFRNKSELCIFLGAEFCAFFCCNSIATWLTKDQKRANAQKTH